MAVQCRQLGRCSSIRRRSSGSTSLSMYADSSRNTSLQLISIMASVVGNHHHRKNRSQHHLIPNRAKGDKRSTLAIRNSFYSLRQSLKRTGCGRARRWPRGAKTAYLLICFLFKRAYAGYGMAADSVHAKESGTVTKILL